MTPALGQTRRAVAAGNRRSAAAARSEAAVRRQTRTAPTRVHRRVSGPAVPARAPQRDTPGLRPLPVLGTIGSHALRAGKSLHDSSLLDRLVRGRGWVAMIGVLLIGLVGLNVSLLKLNAQAGRNAAASRELRISSAELNGKVTRLASPGRLQAAGEKLGMVTASPGSIKYLTSHGRSDGKLAAQKLDQGALAGTLLTDPVEAAPVTTTETAPETTTQATTEPAPVEPPTTTGGGVAAPVATEPAPGTG